MFKCKYCGKEFETKEQLGGHIVWCKESPNRNGHSGFKKYDDVPEEDMGKKVIMRNCDKHGYTEFTLRKDGVYRCKKCAADAVQKRRRKLKEELVTYKGGKCEKCGYEGDIELIKTDDGNFKFICPNCGNDDDETLDVTARICGYLGKVNAGNANKGRLDDIYNRVIHTDIDENKDAQE